MTCTHLKQLYQLCQDNKLRLSSTDLIHVVCQQCDKDEVCPSVLMDEFDADDASPVGSETQQDVAESE